MCLPACPQVKDIGVVLGHDGPGDWDGKLMSELAVALAGRGYLVMRYICRCELT